MRAERFLPLCLLAILVVTASPARAAGPTRPDDQQHAFDFHFGTWRTHILVRGSSPSPHPRWVHMTGTVTDLPLWHGRANLEKIEAAGSGSHFEGLTLFLYDRRTGEWRQQFASSSDGILQEPLYGRFEHGRGVLYGWSTSQGKRTLERDTWSQITRSAYHFEIASSADGGKTWITRFIAQLTRLKRPPDETPRAAGAGAAHDFDFDVGSWRTRIRAMSHPSGSGGRWVRLRGTHVVQRVWDGWADVGQLEVDGPGGHIEDLALRLYDRRTGQWRIYFANSTAGTLDPPMIGAFKGGVGTFVGLEDRQGRTVLSRNVWSRITPSSCHQAWAISSDGGRTWSSTWVSTDTRS